jgi:replicative DNA helicase
MNKYVRLCETVQDKGRLIPYAAVESLGRELWEILNIDEDKDWYTSLYYYGEDAMKHFTDHGNSLAGFNGAALTNRLFFDFDSSDLEESKSDVRKLLVLLDHEGVNVPQSTNVYFSGNKGFHVEVLIDKELTPEQLKEVCSSIAQKFETFDPQIYNINRIIRLVNTKHQKTGLYKIQLDPYCLKTWTIETIKDKAKQKCELKPATTPFVAENLLLKYRTPTKSVPVVVDASESPEGIRGLDKVDFNKCPAHVPRCIYALSKGVMMPGERSRVFFRLAAYYRNQGLDKEVTHRILKGISSLNAKLYPESQPITKEEIWNQHIASAYSSTAEVRPGGYGSSADNDLIKHYCDAAGQHTDRKCIHHARNSQTITQIGDVSSSFQNFAENFKRNSVRTGIQFIDKYMNITVGTTTLLVGACGSGKTTVALNIMENANKLGQHTMFFSLDMHKNLVYLKLAQKLTNYSQKEIIEFYENKDQARIKEIKDAIATAYDKTFFDFTASLTLEEMRDRVFQAEAQHNCKIKLVVVDYASRISSNNSDSYANARYNALRSTEIASDTDAAWIYISQISRNTGDGSTPLRTKRAAKESGDWEESATNVITVWRPYMGCSGDDPLTKDNVLRMFLAKNRMGKELEKALWWDGATGLVWDMEPEEEETYKNIDKREEKEQEILKSRFKKV